MHQVVRRARDDLDPDGRPPWTGDDKAMLLWLLDRCTELVKKIGALQNAAADKSRDDFAEHEKRYPWDVKIAQAIIAAESGDIQPLRELYPHLAQFLHPPKMRRGDTFARKKVLPGFRVGWAVAVMKPSGSQEYRLTVAIEAVKLIQFIWVKYYGKKNRKRDERSAAWFAARMWGLTEEKVLAAIKAKRLCPPDWPDIIPTEIQ